MKYKVTNLITKEVKYFNTYKEIFKTLNIRELDIQYMIKNNNIINNFKIEKTKKTRAGYIFIKSYTNFDLYKRKKGGYRECFSKYVLNQKNK